MNRKQAALFIAHDLLTLLRGEITNLVESNDADVIVGTCMERLPDLLKRIEGAAREAQK